MTTLVNARHVRVAASDLDDVDCSNGAGSLWIPVTCQPWRHGHCAAAALCLHGLLRRLLLGPSLQDVRRHSVEAQHTCHRILLPGTRHCCAVLCCPRAVVSHPPATALTCLSRGGLGCVCVRIELQGVVCLETFLLNFFVWGKVRCAAAAPALHPNSPCGSLAPHHTHTRTHPHHRALPWPSPLAQW